jgi:hypothetical protein
MVEPFSLSAVGALAATEGIKFLYAQAAEVLKRWRDRKAGKEGEAQAPIPVAGAEVLEGKLDPPKVNFEAVERLQDDIRTLAGVLANYASGVEEPNPGDRELAEAADGLRRALEVVYGQRITFQGETRESSGPMVVGHADVEKVVGDVAGVRVRLMKSGRIHGTLTSDEVTGRGSAVEIDTMG